MGRNYSFEVVFETTEVDDVLSRLGDMLTEHDRQRIQRSLPWQPEHIVRRWIPHENRLFAVQRGIKGVREFVYETCGRYCFSLHIPLSGNLRRLSREYIAGVQIQESRQAYIDIGCVWTELRIGREWGLLALTAVSTGMSLLFQASVEIQQALVDALGPCTKVILLYDYEGWEDEEKEVTLLHPWRGKMSPWDRDQAWVFYDYYFEEQLQYSMNFGLDPDRYAALVMGRLRNS